VWIAEVVLTAITTLSLLPMLFLYVLDLAGGTIAPDAAWALGAVIGLLGIWVALLIPDSRYQRNPAFRWSVVAALAIATTFLAKLAWDSVRAGGMDFGFGLFVNVAAAGVALHQLARLILRSEQSWK
jgi:hypothetical protein